MKVLLQRYIRYCCPDCGDFLQQALCCAAPAHLGKDFSTCCRGRSIYLQTLSVLAIASRSSVVILVG